MDQYTRLAPELLEKLKAEGVRTLPVTVEVNGERKVIGSSEVSFDEEGIHMHTSLVDDRWSVLFDGDVKHLSFTPEP